jgi:hypothetical protein
MMKMTKMMMMMIHLVPGCDYEYGHHCCPGADLCCRHHHGVVLDRYRPASAARE